MLSTPSIAVAEITSGLAAADSTCQAGTSEEPTAPPAHTHLEPWCHSDSSLSASLYAGKPLWSSTRLKTPLRLLKREYTTTAAAATDTSAGAVYAAVCANAVMPLSPSISDASIPAGLDSTPRDAGTRHMYLLPPTSSELTHALPNRSCHTYCFVAAL